uniref:Uncharacterized protein n=1 Tax=Aegilops tauschii subsp. strangulata TaxID=200361 RepID=A0A453EAY8_AEGTS
TYMCVPMPCQRLLLVPCAFMPHWHFCSLISVAVPVPHMVRPDAAARRGRPRPHPGDPPLARRALRPLRVAPHGAAARGGGARQPARREVGAPPQGARAHLPHGEPQDAAAVHREDGGGHGGEVGHHGRPRVRRGRDRRVRVVPDRDRGRHHAHGLWPELRGRQGSLQAADAANGLRLRGIPQGLHPWIQVLADQEEHELVETGQGDQEEPGDAHRPAAGGHGRREAPRVRQGPPRPHDQRQQQRRQERAAGQPHHRERHRGGVQDVLLRRQADDVQPPDMDHRGARHAPGVAGACQAGGPRSLRRARHPLPRAARQAQDCKHDPERDAAAVPSGGGDGAAGQVRRGARRLPHPARHGAADPHHGRAPRRAAVGAGRDPVQPGAVRGRRGAGGQAPDSLHTLRARRADVHRPEPGAPGGQAHGGHHSPAVRVPAVAQVRPRAHGPDAPPPAVRRARDLPIPLIIPDARPSCV